MVSSQDINGSPFPVAFGDGLSEHQNPCKSLIQTIVDCEPAFGASHPDHEAGLFVADGTKGISAHSVTDYL